METGMFEEPNIFDYATNELSHDAFYCWLLEWAGKNYQYKDPHLHKLALAFVRKFTGDECITVDKIDIKRQVKGVDIVAIINGKYAIFIEDKLNSSARKNQLNDYPRVAAERYPDYERRFILIKTGNQFHYKQEKEANFCPFTRKDILELMRTCASQHPIFKGYLAYLEGLQSDFDSWQKTSLKELSASGWVGLIHEIADQANKYWGANYGNVEIKWQNRGQTIYYSFMGMTHPNKSVNSNNICLYFQLEKELPQKIVGTSVKLVMKISTQDKINQSQREVVLRYLSEVQQDLISALCKYTKGKASRRISLKGSYKTWSVFNFGELSDVHQKAPREVLEDIQLVLGDLIPILENLGWQQSE